MSHNGYSLEKVHDLFTFQPRFLPDFLLSIRGFVLLLLLPPPSPPIPPHPSPPTLSSFLPPPPPRFPPPSLSLFLIANHINLYILESNSVQQLVPQYLLISISVSQALGYCLD